MFHQRMKAVAAGTTDQTNLKGTGEPLTLVATNGMTLIISTSPNFPSTIKLTWSLIVRVSMEVRRRATAQGIKVHILARLDTAKRLNMEKKTLAINIKTLQLAADRIVRRLPRMMHMHPLDGRESNTVRTTSYQDAANPRRVLRVPGGHKECQAIILMTGKTEHSSPTSALLAAVGLRRSFRGMMFWLRSEVFLGLTAGWQSVAMLARSEELLRLDSPEGS